MHQIDIVASARRSRVFPSGARSWPNSASLLLMFFPLPVQAEEPSLMPALSAPPEVVGSPYWVSHEDFPADALRSGGEGTVGIRLSVDPAGHVYRCVVTKASGWPSLDAVTCSRAMKRARFNPAYDAQQQPIYASYSFYTTWMNPNGQLKPVSAFDRLDTVLSVKRLPPAASAVMWIRQIVEADGTISACEAPDQKTDKALARAVCGYLGEQKATIISDAENKPVRAVVALRVGFIIG